MPYREGAMSNHIALSRWDAAIAAYLSSRHALGRAYAKEELVLRHLRAFLARRGAHDLDQPLFDQWRRQFSHLSASTRIIREISVYNFCRYRRRTELRCFLPDRFALARARPHPLPTPIERGQVARLLRYVSALLPTRFTPLRSAVLRLAIVLLYTSGLRPGEVARLTLDDVEARSGVLRIRESKFHKSRWVPLSRSAAQELRRFLRTRRAIANSDSHLAAPLLCRSRGRPYSRMALSQSLKRAMIGSRIWAGARRVPRVHDFRHSFAVAALLRWYKSHADVQSNLPKLALYMGHVSIVSTAYYLRFMPAVVRLAGQRFERAFGGLIQGGAL
jgi:integrase/recombinase XerD